MIITVINIIIVIIFLGKTYPMSVFLIKHMYTRSYIKLMFFRYQLEEWDVYLFGISSSKILLMTEGGQGGGGKVEGRKEDYAVQFSCERAVTGSI